MSAMALDDFTLMSASSYHVCCRCPSPIGEQLTKLALPNREVHVIKKREIRRDIGEI